MFVLAFFLNGSYFNIRPGSVPSNRHCIYFLVNIVSNNMPIICMGPCGLILTLFQIRAEVQAANRPAAIAVCSHSAGKQMLLTSKHGHQQLLESQSSPLVETQEED